MPIFSSRTKRSRDETAGSQRALLLDMGIIPSLFLVWWKCHSPRRHLQALEFPEAWPNEGDFGILTCW